ncbi:MAG: hypothetical protein P4L49_00040 [Desulfosporosinus sp.]|nr:hypothetical protein [Desulfosporosinus sp.]
MLERKLMKKFISMFVVSCCILLCSCSFNSSQSDASSGAILPTQSVVKNADAASNNKLTMGGLIALVKKDTLTLDDFSSFTNGTNHESEYSLTKYLSENYFSKNDIIELARSVHFNDSGVD